MGNTSLLVRLTPVAGALATLAAFGCAWLIARSALAPAPGIALLACGIAGIALMFLIPLRITRGLRAQVAGLQDELRAAIAETKPRPDATEAHESGEQNLALSAVLPDPARPSHPAASPDPAASSHPAALSRPAEPHPPPSAFPSISALATEPAMAAPEADQPEDEDDLVASVTDLVTSLAARLGKSVTVRAEGFDSRTLSPDRRLAVKDVLIQLARNSVVHGIEPADERVRAGKPPAGTIALLPVPALPDGSFGFTFGDDGRGLDVARIRECAVARGFLGREAADDADDAAVAALVFLSGFSTLDESPAAPARGAGLALIEQRVVDDCGGELTVDSHPGESCTFSFVLPERARKSTGPLAASPS
jgi:hypothetical protein